jgi:hypothetical protein
VFGFFNYVVTLYVDDADYIIGTSNCPGACFVGDASKAGVLLCEPPGPEKTANDESTVSSEDGERCLVFVPTRFQANLATKHPIYDYEIH